MKKTLLLLLSCLLAFFTQAQSSLEVKKFVLDNGFTVFLNEDPTAKEVYGAVVVKAGSKNDPASATGIAHYLEHLLFKGTTDLGTVDFSKEKPFLDSINYYYDRLGETKDEKERARLQMLINNQSVQAAKYALPTEFDKLIQSIGGTGLNAFTTPDMTVYHNAFPAHQVEKWLDLYSHRFQKPVFRSFQSELEVVYEEKNRSMDNFQVKLFELVNKNLFRHHPYGTQTTLGSVEHLKNPSLTKMYAFFNSYYVANNMALVLCGNFNAEEVMPLIRKKFSALRSGTVPGFPKYPATVFKDREDHTVRYTPIRVSVIGYKTIPNVHADKAALEVCSSLLINESETGMLNKLKRDGKLLFAAGYSYTNNDDGAFMLLVVPRIIGQSFRKAERLVFAELEKLKKGEITDKELQMVKTELYRQQQEYLENARNRAYVIVQAFSEGSNWEDHLHFIRQLDQVSRDDIKRVASKYFGSDYFALHSRMGFPKKTKLKKPGFKPVLTEQKEESSYAKHFDSIPSGKPVPRFLNVDHDAAMYQLNRSNRLYVVKNPVNDVFSLTISFQVGSDSLKNLELASGIFSYMRTKDLTVDQLKEEFAMLGLSSYASCSRQRFTLSFTGLEKNLEKSLQLIDKLIHEAEADEKAMKNLRNDIRAERKASDKQPNTLGDALFEYAKFGAHSPYLDRPSRKEIKKMEPQELTDLFRKATGFNSVIYYTGTTSPKTMSELVASRLKLADQNSFVALADPPYRNIEQNAVYLLHDKKAVQSQVYFFLHAAPYHYSPMTNASIRAFNEYMDGGFSGLILQEIREYRSLAYSTYGGYSKPYNQKAHNPGTFFAYIGCQSDKTNEAIAVMDTLLNHMPQKPERMETVRSMVKNSVNANFPNFRYIGQSIEQIRQAGYHFTPLMQEYPMYDSLSFNDILSFYESNIKGRPRLITVYGNRKNIRLPELARYGRIVELKRKDVIRD